MADELAPPPPPLSPPPALATTTIGKYIARFRYEKPQPREARVAAQQSEFWWTKSPRYSRSPSPPSTWASGGVFSFPDEELDEELSSKTDEEETKSEEVDGSVESKLRRRLGLSSDSKQGISDTREELRVTIPEITQSWDSEEWGSVDLEEEDPEEVIERVRKRLGWSTTSGKSSSKLKPIEFRLSIDSDRDSGPRHLGMKPPLSPGLYRREEVLGSFGYRSNSSWSEQSGRERFEVVSPIITADVKDRSVGVDPVDKMEEKEAVHHEGESSEASETKSVNDKLSPTGFPATALRSSSSPVNSHCSEGSKSNEGFNDAPVNARVEEVDNTTSLLDTSESKGGVEERECKEQPRCKTPERDADDQVSELPRLPTVSPARPDSAPPLASPSSNDDLSGRSHDSSLSSPRKEELFSSEEAKTIDSIFNSMLHDWENNFYSFSESGSEQEEVSPVEGKQEHETESKEDPNYADYTCPATNAAAPSNENLSTVVNTSGEVQEVSSGDQNPTTISSAEIASEETKLSEIADIHEEFTQSDLDGEEKQDYEVPGEDDEIVQMLLGRIVLLEEALRQIDS